MFFRFFDLIPALNIETNPKLRIQFDKLDTRTGLFGSPSVECSYSKL